MLVSEKQVQMIPLSKRPGKNSTAEASDGLQGAMLQTLQSNVQAKAAQVQQSATQNATQQVSEASRISDNVDEAFAKTRVGLQATSAQLPADVQLASDAFKEYMSKTPEERMQDAILEEMGLTKEEVEQMPPEKQQAIAKEIAERMEDKIKLAQAEKENGSSEKGSSQVVDKFLASL
ncbi:MAG: hypothetical protein ABWZ65_16765 [Pseudomonas mandelii]